jgi:tRNA dimethylallyltransferase
LASPVKVFFTIVPTMQPLFLVGPTAVGKSAVALELARGRGAEIVSADSMQVYRGLDIGTAKIKGQHLVDVCDITEHFDVKRYILLAESEISNLRSAIICGGTGLYIRALRQGLFEGPGRNATLRARLEARPATELFAELQRLDPQTATAIDRHNPRRLVRALEVFHATGKSIRELQSAAQAFSLRMNSTGKLEACPAFGLNRQRADLYRRIEQRVDAQMAAGWLDEVRRLMGQGLEQNKTAMQAAGYRELVAHLRGELSLAEAVALIKTRTRQLARRQLTWFRREPGLIWIDVKPDESPTETAGRILQYLEDA